MKNGFGVASAIAALLLPNALVSAQSGLAASFRGGASHPGIYAGRDFVTQPAIKWQFRTAGRFIGSPTVAAGSAYIGNTDGNLYAFDASTGRKRWAFHTEARITSTPAVWNGSVYVMSYDGSFYAIDERTGKSRWTFRTKGERRYAGKNLHGFPPAGETMPDPFDLYLSSPAIVDGVVYVGSGDGNVYALDALTGRLRWRFQTGDVVHSSPAVVDGVVYVGSWDRYMYALDARRGTPIWKFQTGQDTVIHNQVGIQSSPTVVGGVVYFGCRDAHVYAVDARTGRQRWAFFTGGAWVLGTPVVDAGVVYVGTGDSEQLVMLDAASGKQLSALRLGWYLFGSPAIVGNTLLIGSWNGKLSAIDLKTRRVAWVYQPASSKANIAAFTKPDGTLRLRPAGSEVFYDALVTAIDRSFSMGGLLASPVIADGTIYIASVDGVLTALH